jgi:uncharacterized cupredoxin-like copper-binding protein
VTAAGVVGLVALAGCGGDDERAETSGTGTEGEAAPAAGAPVATVKVGETEYKLDPSKPKVAKAGTVEFDVQNNGQVVHALEVEGPSGESETESIQPGKSAKLKVNLNKAGTYEMYCPIDNHKGRGMTGEVKVAGGGSSGGESGETDTSEGGGGSPGY